MTDPVFHVLLDGQPVGPYDRRTIVGMRIKGTLSSEHVLIASDGSQMTVGDLVQARPREPSFQPQRTGSYSLVQATYSASVREVEGRGFEIPPFKEEVEARVQQDGVLRIAGRYRQGFAWKEDRVKLPLAAVAHARVTGSTVDLWLRPERGTGLQRVQLELFTHEVAGEFVDWLPNATPWPGAALAGAGGSSAAGAPFMLWGALVGTVLVVGGVLVWVLSRH